MANLTDLFDTEEFRAMGPWFLKLQMTPLRTNAYQAHAITYGEMQTLEAMEVKGPQTHNAALLAMVRAPGSKDAFKCLAEAVKLLGPAYKTKYDQMMAILDLGKGSGASADCGGGSGGGDDGGVGAVAAAAVATSGASGGMPFRRDEVSETTKLHPDGYVEYECKKYVVVSGPQALEPQLEAMAASGPPPCLIMPERDTHYIMNNDSRLSRADATPIASTPPPVGPPPMNSNVMTVGGSHAGAEHGTAAAGVAGANDRGDRSSAPGTSPGSNTDVHRLLDDTASLSTSAVASASAEGVQQPRSVMTGNSRELPDNNVPFKDTRSHPTRFADRYQSTTGSKVLRSKAAPAPNVATPRLTSTSAQHTSYAPSLPLAHPGTQPDPQAAGKFENDVMMKLHAMQQQIASLTVNSSQCAESGGIVSVQRNGDQAHRQGANYHRRWSGMGPLTSDPCITPVSAQPAVGSTRHSGQQPADPPASLCLHSQPLGTSHQSRGSQSTELLRVDWNNIPRAMLCDYEVFCQRDIPVEGAEVTYLIDRPSFQSISGSDIIQGSEWSVAFFYRSNQIQPFHLERAENVSPSALVFRIPRSPTGRYLVAYLQPLWLSPVTDGREYRTVISTLRTLKITYK